MTALPWPFTTWMAPNLISMLRVARHRRPSRPYSGSEPRVFGGGIIFHLARPHLPQLFYYGRSPSGQDLPSPFRRRNLPLEMLRVSDGGIRWDADDDVPPRGDMGPISLGSMKMGARPSFPLGLCRSQEKLILAVTVVVMLCRTIS